MVKIMQGKLSTPLLLAVVGLVVVVVVVGVGGSGPPTLIGGRLPQLFAEGGYSVMSGDASLDDLKRGHDGLMVKINQVTRSLKEDELKLNNIFYKLGSHDNNLEGVDSNLHTLTDSSRRIEAKLNKHAYNVDFLRRQVEQLRQRWEAESRVEVEVATVRLLTDRLDNRLTDALARLGLVENTTKTLEKRSTTGHTGHERSPEGQLGVIQAAERPPTLTVYPQPSRERCAQQFERVGNDCYWFGGEQLTFTEATAACLGHGGTLLTLPAPSTQLNLLLARLLKDTLYWTGGTDAFRHGSWAYLMTAQPVMPLHWAANHTRYHTHHCAGLTPLGLTPLPCVQRHPYVCQPV